MKIFSYILLAVCMLGLILGFANVGSASFSGLSRAFGAIFFILFFIARVADAASVEEQEAMHAK